jgi:hypothetical protein
VEDRERREESVRSERRKLMKAEKRSKSFNLVRQASRNNKKINAI